jgi:L-lactate dehydrogenase complex protein LldG
MPYPTVNPFNARCFVLWINRGRFMQEDLSSLGLLSQHLVVPLDPNANMHEAYARGRLDQTAYGCFVMGPSATDDVEASLVHGAHGSRSSNLFFLPGSGM